jgi:hypothetical protein
MRRRVDALDDSAGVISNTIPMPNANINILLETVLRECHYLDSSLK